jgi:hypothetical protein
LYTDLGTVGYVVTRTDLLGRTTVSVQVDDVDPDDPKAVREAFERWAKEE